MNDFVSRLICAGMPRPVAVSVCKQFMRDHGIVALAQYVDEVEAENGKLADVE